MCDNHVLFHKIGMKRSMGPNQNKMPGRDHDLPFEITRPLPLNQAGFLAVQILFATECDRVPAQISRCPIQIESVHIQAPLVVPQYVQHLCLFLLMFSSFRQMDKFFGILFHALDIFAVLG